ncbi:hypothetical protein FB45DRAFT_1039670 [Roridomyces roridus]|uniref:Uncharacterized protein n=1 Tax=Roridomyces roridus TaxID=1738132 RepID=A0AAD7B223_9AGAR|nr:hypothetical protein FB45DRAFT_1039670 [Roridomyces roridus]
MFPPELVELIIRYGWQCLSTSSHRHAYSMTCWMLVSREWLSIIVPIFLGDVWVTSQSLLVHLIESCRSPGLAYTLAGITDVKQYLAQNCRSLTVSAYQRRTGEYTIQCTELAEYVADPTRMTVLHRWPSTHREPYCGIPLEKLRNVIFDWMPNVTSIHFVLVDCLPTYWYWDAPCDSFAHARRTWSMDAFKEDCVTEVHFTFACTSSPPSALVSAARNTFTLHATGWIYQPVISDRIGSAEAPRQTPLPRRSGNAVLVVRDANADFIAFLTTEFPELECIESTAQFGAQDLPPEVTERVGDRMAFKRLAPTTNWGIVGSDLKVRPKEERPVPATATATDPAPVPKVDPSLAPKADASTSPKSDAPAAPHVELPIKPARKEDMIPVPEKKQRSFWSVVKRGFKKGE